MSSFDEFVHDVRVLCHIYGGSITSWGRTDDRNEKVGGVANSWHRWKRGGLAVDITFDDDHGRELALGGFRHLGYEVIEYPSHIHVEPAG